jgi:hypothetical protein
MGKFTINSSKLSTDASSMPSSEIFKAMKRMGFVQNLQDPCVFNMDRHEHQVTVCFYIDDLLITSVDGDDIKWVAADSESIVVR